MTDHEIAPEFSRTILADKVGTDETVQTIKARPDECVRLTERLDLQSLENFSATIRLLRIRGGRITEIRISGEMPSVEETAGEVEFAGRQWHWLTTVLARPTRSASSNGRFRS
mgnify:CR=1 FL=1